MGGRSASPATPHENWWWSRNRAATLPVGTVGEEEAKDDPTLAATTPFTTDVKAFTAASKIPKDVRPSAGGGSMGCPLSP